MNLPAYGDNNNNNQFGNNNNEDGPSHIVTINNDNQTINDNYESFHDDTEHPYNVIEPTNIEINPELIRIRTRWSVFTVITLIISIILCIEIGFPDNVKPVDVFSYILLIVSILLTTFLTMIYCFHCSNCTIENSYTVVSILYLFGTIWSGLYSTLLIGSISSWKWEASGTDNDTIIRVLVTPIIIVLLLSTFVMSVMSYYSFFNV